MIKRIKQLRVNAYVFSIKWDPTVRGASFSYLERQIVIGTKDATEDVLLEFVCHELFELCCVEHGLRFNRPDCDTDFLFVLDHRQHTSVMSMFTGLLTKFLE